MKKWIPLVMALFMLAGCGKSEISYRRVDMKEAMSRMEKEKDYVILDVRTREEFNQGHIPGAICIPNETIGKTPVPELPNLDQLIFVYCRSGNRSKQAAGKLAQAGYTNLVEFGGIRDWPGEIVKD